jgi:hypothetical protein
VRDGLYFNFNGVSSDCFAFAEPHAIAR